MGFGRNSPNYFWRLFLFNLDVFFSSSDTQFVISYERLVRLAWNKKGKCIGWIGGSTLWLWPLTSAETLNFSRSTFEIAPCQELLVWFMVKEANPVDTGPPMWYFPVTTPLTLPWCFKVKIWYSLISWIGRPIDMERKGRESIIHDHGQSWSIMVNHSWPWSIMVNHGQSWSIIHDHDPCLTKVGWVNVTGVTSENGLPSTHLIESVVRIQNRNYKDRNL